MLQYPTPSDLHYGDVGDTSMPQGGTQWGPGRPDSSQPAVNRDADDRQRAAQQLRASQQPPSNYTPATTYMITSRDSYPAQAQSHCSGQYPYPSQPYPSSVNYVLPPYDFAEYPINAVNAHHGGQYSPHASVPIHYQYPPSDPVSFHSAYDPTGYFPSDGPLCSPLVGQHQHSLVPVPSSYSHYDDYLGHYEHYVQPQIPSTLPSSSSSELGHALVETPPPESQSINHGSIALPSLPMPSPSAPKRDPSETLVSVKTEYASSVSGQPFSPMTSMSALPLSSELASLPKEESQEQVHVFPTPVVTHGRLQHRPHTHDSFRLVQDPAAFPGFNSPPPSKRPPSLAIPGSLAYSPSARIPTPLSSSFSSSDVATPTSSIHLVDTSATSSSQAPPAASLAPNPKAGQGVLKLPSTKRSARRKPAIACLFCRERKIACGAPPVGSADPTCNQCARRSRKCEYPTMSRRGLHKRRDNGGSHHKESEDADYVPNT